MTTVVALETDTHLPQLVERVAQGESITITQHGRPVAVLVPPPTEKPDVDATIQKILDFGKGRSLGGFSIRNLVEEGRRF